MVFYNDIEEDTIKNENYRKVLYTNPGFQLVLMSLLPEEEIGSEVHSHTTQFIRIEKGIGAAVIDDDMIYYLHDGISITIPPNTKHNIINLSTTQKLKLYTIYTPPTHKENTICYSKTDCED